MSDETIKLAIVLAYMAGLLGLGMVAARRVKDARDYFAANKSLGFWATAFSARATGESAWLLLGLTGLGATVGLHGMWIVLGELVGVAGAWMFMARPFKRLTDVYDAITIPDYLEARFRDTQQRIRRLAAVVLVVFVTIYVSAQIDATGTAFESFLGWNYYVGAFVGFAVVLVYITTGGFLAVAWSDVVQGALMFIGLVVLPIAAVIAAGGIGPVETGLIALDPTLLSFSHGGWTSVTIMSAIGGAMIGAGFLGSPQIFVRYLAMRSENEIGRGTAVAVIWTLLADSGAVLSGLLGRYLLTKPGDTAQDVAAIIGNGGQDVLPLLVAEIFPVVVVGIYVAIVLSAIMSTVDSLLVMAASAVVRDWYQKVKHPEMSDASLTSMARKVTVALAVVALSISVVVAMTMPGRTVFWFVIFGWSGLAATFCPTMILSLGWSGFTARGVIAAMSTGFISVPLFKFVIFKLPVVGPLLTPLTVLPPAFLLSFIAAWLASVTDPGQAALREAVQAELSAANKR